MRTSDRYEDVELPYPDAKVAGKLCVGGPARYMIKEGSGVTLAFILLHVTPEIKNRLGDDIALTLGHCLLWAVCSSKASDVRHFYLLPTHVPHSLPGRLHGIESSSSLV